MDFFPCIANDVGLNPTYTEPETISTAAHYMLGRVALGGRRGGENWSCAETIMTRRADQKIPSSGEQVQRDYGMPSEIESLCQEINDLTKNGDIDAYERAVALFEQLKQMTPMTGLDFAHICTVAAHEPFADHYGTMKAIGEMAEALVVVLSGAPDLSSANTPALAPAIKMIVIGQMAAKLVMCGLLPADSPDRAQCVATLVDTGWGEDLAASRIDAVIRATNAVSSA